MRDLKVLLSTLLIVFLSAGGALLTPDFRRAARAQQKRPARPAAKPENRQLDLPPPPEPTAKTKQGAPTPVVVNAAAANQRRLALVIGNNAYTKAPLQNPINDARLIEETLRELGFEVIKGENLSRAEMREAVDSFGRKLGVGGIALFYYAGHGVQVNGRNYLVPTGYGSIKSLEDAESELLNAEEVLKAMAAKQGLNIMILDACRNLPTKLGFTAADKPGFAEIRNTPGGTFVAYSTSPGKTAADGTGDNSPYSTALARSLRMRPSRLEDVFIHTRIELDESTGGAQVPWENSSIKTVFHFTPDAVSATPLPNLAYHGTLRNQLLKGLLGGLRQSDFAVPVTNSNGRVTSQLNGHSKFFVEAQASGLEMVEIPGGRFAMGSHAADAEAAYADAKRYDEEETRETVTAEMPQHNVNVKGFYMSRYEITQAQWLAVMGSLPRLEGKSRGDDLPVVNVSYRDVEEFCARLSRLTGRLYRLPSEAEWEYACRAGSVAPFAFGLNVNAQLVNYNGIAPFGAAEARPSRRAAQPAGQSGAANAFGLYDMHGNVWEWCADNWHDGYDGAPTDGSVWEEADEDTRAYRVIRGGSWDSIANSCRSASRRKAAVTAATKKLGFRVVAG
ncbi:MAG TPA: SUMF1/EgtB/PvdO family nonheme iron enzyme [Pyrinomonadaceae bacterium]|nr:SUMF1/EgtB/PvdO family nonheme iron enzyme [Pyrinomonadaceae bacterium]